MADTFVQVYPFDPTGKLASNRVVGEQQILTEANGVDYHLIVPKFAPFFTESLVITIKTTDGETKELKEGVDFLYSHWFIAASRACANPVYGSISILDTTLAGVVTLAYNTLGGIWSLNADDISNILSDYIHNPRITAWDEVIDKPIVFPVIDHEWDLVDLVGMSDVVASIDKIQAAIVAKEMTGLGVHLNDYDNPHNTTAAQIGCYTQAQVDALITTNNATMVLKYEAAIQAAIQKYIAT